MDTTKTAFILSIECGCGDSFRRLFHGFDNAVKYVLHKVRVKCTDADEKIDEASDSLYETNAWTDEENGIVYTIEAEQFED